MALVNCPECQHEVSDTLETCPHCGYVLKKKAKNYKALPIILLIIVIAIVGGVYYYLNIMKPTQIMDEAQNLIERGKYSEAEVVLASVPACTRKSGMLAEISLKEATEALQTGDYELAESKLALVPEESITSEIRYDLNSQKASALIGQGRFLEADALYAELEQNDDIIAIRKQLFIDSRVLHCALEIKDDLINPESIELSEVAVFEPGSRKDESASTETTEVRNIDEPDILFHYRAKTRSGNLSDGFILFEWDGTSYIKGTSVDDLDNDEDPPSYLSTSEQADYNLAKAWINLKLYSSFTLLDDERLARLNSAVVNCSNKSVEFIDYNDVVPKPTPKVIEITPEPTATEAPATEAPATEEPATEALATEEAATEEPATEAPATEAPAA